MQLADLRSPTIAIIESGKYPKEDGQVMTADCEGLGIAHMSFADGEVHFYFEDHRRLFVLGKDNVLVERVDFQPSVRMAFRELSVLEREILKIEQSGKMPYENGETKMFLFGPNETSQCFATRTPKGVIIDFPAWEKSYYFDPGTKRIRSYKDKAPSAKKVKRLEVEKADTMRVPQPVYQKGYDGAEEIVDFGVYCNPIRCKTCGGIRYVKNADVHQVKTCKPCTERERVDRRNKRRREIHASKRVSSKKR